MVTGIARKRKIHIDLLGLFPCLELYFNYLDFNSVLGARFQDVDRIMLLEEQVVVLRESDQFGFVVGQIMSFVDL